VTICYEDSIAGLIRKFVRDGADFMVNITNDGWFRDSSELDMHLAICVMRAVENRVTIARCANTGISAFISPTGEILAQVVREDGKRREIEGALPYRLSPFAEPGFYTRHGDVFAWACLAASVLLPVGVFLRRKNGGKTQA
jgi:apolipoprotein N-acyltransferase